MPEILKIHLGDSGAVIPITLHQATDEDPNAVFAITETHTVKFTILTKNRRVVVAETLDGVTVTDGEAGQLTIQLEPDSLTSACDYPLYVRVYDANDRRLTAPVLTHDFILSVVDD